MAPCLGIRRLSTIIHKQYFRAAEIPLKSSERIRGWTFLVSQLLLDAREFVAYFTLCRWGNTPAIDLINLSNNEKAKDKDFSLAFIGKDIFDIRYSISNS